MDANCYGLSTMVEPLDSCHGSDIDIWGGGAVLSLLSKPVAKGAVAEKGDDADFAVKTLQDVLGLIGGDAQGHGQPMDGLRSLAQERDEVSFFCGQRTNV
jgi:hypothetical protein